MAIASVPLSKATLLDRVTASQRGTPMQPVGRDEARRVQIALAAVSSRKRDEHFWWTTLVRGFGALVAGSAILVVPEMARMLLLLPIAMLVAVLGLAVYGIVDSALIFASSFMATSIRLRLALRLQGVLGVLVGLLLYVVFLDRARLRWFLVLVAVQCFTTALAEFILARHTPRPGDSRWDYAGSAVALVFGAVYLSLALASGDSMMEEEIAWLVYAWLLAAGLALSLKAARMLYADYRWSGEDLCTSDV